ncbi:MAG: hypothetical protein UV60_C0001G0012 [Parcubacteria group bacterium GW2011_GWA2_43_11]|nr:MAG: hypothetical protein UU89_C0006G0014 [Parcubacteria group bacterium GW2011_GWC2_42_11]KKS86413.1 MAG: hypothetical protein UV60_C0001G0012 [Parcubacteria group bacterium GW2011_GWA2_43_11]
MSTRTLFKQHPQTTSLLVRILLFCTVILTAIIGPWWFSFGLAVVLLIFFKYYEVVLGGLILDILFAGEGFSLAVGDFLFTIILLFMISFSLLFLQRFRSISSL